MASGSPMNDIMEMKQRGLSNNEIIQNLQRQGYSNTQIFDAMSQADTKIAVEGNMQPISGGQPPRQSYPMPQQESELDQEIFTQPPMEEERQQQSSNYQAPQQDTSFDENQVKVEELVEAVIEEKWEELVKDVNKIVDWKNKVESRVSEMEVTLAGLRENFSDLQRAILSKVNDYDKHIQEVGSEIQAMEKVFSKVLPRFTENINELSSIAEKLKKGKNENKKGAGSS
ncbi:TPA: hypothetical protein HA239_01375 [Candidatus Woesearchaeota archaeon]|nr:hypothetical protein QT06_C0001G0441 [archaeon GW2011_AR15]HIH41043.1 hypothetical protein [Candidatus Woesearchaeota archaeon]